MDADVVPRRSSTMAVLLLNASFEPLRVITLRRAIGLMVAGKAEVLAEGTGEIRSVSVSFPVPAVVRLRYMVKVPFAASIPLSRRAVLVRDARRCQFVHCERPAATVDHVVPRSRGGAHTWTNVIAACAQCNARKGDRTLQELGWHLKRPPTAPRGPVVLLTAAGVAEAPPVWADYLPA
jgi:5-methylcytosine-specific restriction endonuclease McrA